MSQTEGRKRRKKASSKDEQSMGERNKKNWRQCGEKKLVYLFLVQVFAASGQQLLDLEDVSGAYVSTSLKGQGGILAHGPGYGSQEGNGYFGFFLFAEVEEAEGEAEIARVRAGREVTLHDRVHKHLGEIKVTSSNVDQTYTLSETNYRG
jgi:hypothetical protein